MALSSGIVSIQLRLVIVVNGALLLWSRGTAHGVSARRVDLAPSFLIPVCVSSRASYYDRVCLIDRWKDGGVKLEPVL